MAKTKKKTVGDIQSSVASWSVDKALMKKYPDSRKKPIQKVEVPKKKKK